MPAGSAHTPGLIDRDEVARLLRHADATPGMSPLIDGLAKYLRLALAPPPGPDEIEQSDVQRLLELHRDLLSVWAALGRELVRKFSPEARAAVTWSEDSQRNIDRLAEVSSASQKLTNSLIALQNSSTKAYGTAPEEELDRMFAAECLRIAARIPDEVWSAMVDRRAGR